MTEFSEIKLKTRVPDADIEPMIGRILTDSEYDLLVSGPTSITIPSDTGAPRQLLKYIPGAFRPEEMERFYGTLHELKAYETDNRGFASGTRRVTPVRNDSDGQPVVATRSRSTPVPSAIIGAFDAAPPKNYCRLTAWTGRETEKFTSLFPMFQKVGALFAEHVADRFNIQMGWASKSHQDWVIPGTPFSTATVNNSYPTGVHTDKGDLEEGFSTLLVLRRGNYEGGRLVFPQWRVAVDMQDGDLLLMDAHQWHGNTQLRLLDPECYVAHDEPTRATVRARLWLNGRMRERDLCGAHGAELSMGGAPNLSFEDLVPAERISTVLYYRTKIRDCKSSQEEFERAEAWSEKKIAIGAAQVSEMAEEAAGA